MTLTLANDMSAKRIARLCAALLLVVGIVGCQDPGDEPALPPPEPVFVNWPEALDGLRFRWSAEPGIDLLSGPAVPLRAYLESHRVGDFTLDPDTVYPGFSRAVPKGPPNDETFPDEPYQLWFIEPFTDPRLGFGVSERFYGNEYFHILELTPIEGGYRAYVCDGMYGIVREGADPHTYEPVYSSKGRDSDLDVRAVDVWRVELTDQLKAPDLNAPPMVTAPQQGPNPAPLGDVFGPWRITGASPTTYWGATGGSDPEAGLDPAYRQLMEQCLHRMPHDAAQRPAFYTSEPATPPPAEPAVPGWPDTAI